MGTILKHESLKEALLELVASTPTGSRIPTIAELKSRYKASQSTVDKALGYLKANGYVEASPSRGITVCDRQDPLLHHSLTHVDLLYFGDKTGLSTASFHSELIKHLSYILGEKGAWLRCNSLPHNASIKKIIDFIDDRKCEALLLINLFNSEIINIVTRRKIPYVVMFPNCHTELPNSILIDNRMVARHWISYLSSLGHKRIAYFHSSLDELYQRDQNQRLRFFYEEMVRAKLEANPDWNFYSGYTNEDGYMAAKRFLDAGRPCSAIICGDSAATGVYQALTAASIKIGRDISVIGVDDSSWTKQMNPPLSTVRISREKLAGLAVEKLAEMKTNGVISFENIITTSELIVRESTGPCL